MTRLLAIAWKELVQLRRDRMTFGMMVGLPIMQLMLFGYAINTDVRHMPTLVYDQDHSASYTAQLLSDLDRAAKKMGEEAVETVIAAAQGDRDALTAESADLIYHWLVVIAAAGVSLEEVAERLEAREGTSGLAEKAARGT